MNTRIIEDLVDMIRNRLMKCRSKPELIQITASVAEEDLGSVSIVVHSRREAPRKKRKKTRAKR